MSKKISELTELTTPTASDILPIVNGGTNKKITVDNLSSYSKTKIESLTQLTQYIYVCTGQENPSNTYSVSNQSGGFLEFQFSLGASVGDKLIYTKDTNTLVLKKVDGFNQTMTTTVVTTSTATVLTMKPLVELKFSDMYNTELRVNPSVHMFTENDMIFFNTDNAGFSADYIASFVFYVGATPPTMIYSNSNIIQWVGTGCKIEDGTSIFIPEVGKQYTIVFYYDGMFFQGLVNGIEIAQYN